ncbi:hypothetical protein [Microbacterium sp.]
MMTEEEVCDALRNWRAGLEFAALTHDKTGEAIATGYVGALEMVLRGGK